MNMKVCRRLLAILWILGSGLPFTILVIQSFSGKHGEETTEIWGWLNQAIMPTLGLIVSIIVMDATGTLQAGDRADGVVFGIAALLSFVYLIAITAVFLTQPFVPPDQGSTLIRLQQNQIWIGPLQGLTVASLGAFFVMK